MTEVAPSPSSPASIQAKADLRRAERIAELGQRGGVAYEVRAGKENVWVVGSRRSADLFSLRIGFGGDIQGEPSVVKSDGAWICDWRTPIGALRLTIAFPEAARTTVRCTAALLPSRDVRLTSTLRDLFGPDDARGEVHTAQRGLRTGAFYASLESPHRFSILYVQDFSSLVDFFDIGQVSPSGTVGGTVAEGGYLPPFGEGCVLPASREVVLSDAYVAVSAHATEELGELAGRYLDLLADVYLSLKRPSVEYHDWPERAQRTLRDLCLSPACTYERGGARYLMPYVGDDIKPPESMVQLTVLVNTLEYERWRGAPSALSETLLAGVGNFFDPAIGSVVRWLPGEDFGDQSEENMNHEAMDSWYLYHSLFNVSRLATLGNKTARAMLTKSLGFAVRVARRFNYRWPIFFNLKTLEIVRAEASPGAGGENDVAGLYALVMLHAHELFGDADYLEEAKRAAAAMRDDGFRLGYQTNTTGFAAESTLRLWLLTKDRFYLDLSELCMANILDNMWLWQCGYGLARHYRTFFGLFPLHDAPYLAAYEELEAQAKFNEYLSLGGDDLRPSLRLLLAEYQKYSLDRGWFYYPDALPVDATAPKSRNGHIERALSVPLEDLQDGRKPSGEVGQEIYGSGLAFVYTARHYRVVKALNAVVYCTYPVYEFSTSMRGATSIATFRTGGDPRGDCELRVIPIDADVPAPSVSVHVRSARGRTAIESTVTVEGHAAFHIAGGTQYEIRLSRAAKKRSSTGIPA